MENLYRRKPLTKANKEELKGEEDKSSAREGPSRKMSPKHKLAEKVLEIATRESAFKSFGRTLLEDSFVDYEIHHQAKFVDYKIKVPSSLCFSSVDGANNFCVSAMLALFDELSTMALFVFDKSRRPGVSVDLKTELLRPIREGEMLHVHTIIEKTGKILAFCALEVYNEAGELVARGTHVKFMPMGWVWDFLTSAIMLPIAMFLYQFLRGSKIKTPLDSFFRAKKTKQEIVGPFHHSGAVASTVYKSLDVVPYVPDNDTDRLLYEQPQTQPHGIYHVKVRRDLMNPVKSMHGGAVACSIEEACRQYLQTHYASQSKKLMISELTIQYQAPLKKEALIMVEEDLHSSLLTADSSHAIHRGITGRCVDKKHGRKSVEFTCQIRYI